MMKRRGCEPLDERRAEILPEQSTARCTWRFGGRYEDICYLDGRDRDLLQRLGFAWYQQSQAMPRQRRTKKVLRISGPRMTPLSLEISVKI